MSLGTCTTNADCGRDPYYYCSTAEGLCYRKNLFPATTLEDIGFAVLALLMGLCNVAGIGGGPIDVPLLMGFFFFGTKEAVALSNMVILFGAVTRYIYGLNERHPDKPHCVMIDYSVATVMMALSLAGNLLGVQLILKTFP